MTATKTPAFHKPPLFTRQQLIALLLPLMFGLDGVLYSMPVSDLLTFAVALVLIRQTCHILRQGA